MKIKYWTFKQLMEDDGEYMSVEEYPDEELYEDGEIDRVKAGLKLLNLRSNGDIMIVRQIQDPYDEIQNVISDNRRDTL